MGLVNFHPNIIRFCGVITLKDEINPSLVLEYADGGTLGKYLKDNVMTFKWESQLRFANEIASAILCLHDNEIVHRDLHPDNVLIHQHSIKLADFGRSCIQGSDCHTHLQPYGVIPYMDPKIFNIKETESYNLTKKSDVYSLGMLFWELTSCLSPFNFDPKNDNSILKIEILNGRRENPIPNTNGKFVELYQKCWEYEPDERPDINQVILELNSIDSANKDVSPNFNSKETEGLENDDSDLLNYGDLSDCDLSNYN